MRRGLCLLLLNEQSREGQVSISDDQIHQLLFFCTCMAGNILRLKVAPQMFDFQRQQLFVGRRITRDQLTDETHPVGMIVVTLAWCAIRAVVLPAHGAAFLQRKERGNAFDCRGNASN